MTTTIEAYHLIKRYPNQGKMDPAALTGGSENRIRPTVRSGRPDGAGKTTLIRILSTVILPTSGTAKVAGYDILKQAQSSTSLGIYASGFQSLSRFECYENLRFFADINGVPKSKQKERIDDLLISPAYRFTSDAVRISPAE